MKEIENKENVVLDANKYAKTFWYDWILDNESTQYNLSKVYSMRGYLDIEKFIFSIKEVIRNTLSLKSYYSFSNECLLQHFLSDNNIDYNSIIKYEDLSGLKTEEEALNDLQNEINTVFDLTKPSLVKFKVLKLNNNLTLFFIVCHHILLDGMGGNIMLLDIAKVYNSLIEMGRHDLLTDSTDIKEYLEYEKVNITSKIEDKKSFEFWKEYLNKGHFHTDVPKVNINLDSYKLIKEYRFNISKNFTESIIRFSKKNEFAVFNIIATIFSILLLKYTSLNDIILMYPVNLRPKKFSTLKLALNNSLPLRIKLDNNSTFNSVLKETKRSMSSALRHRFIPIYDLISFLKQNKIISTNDTPNLSITNMLDIDRFKLKNLDISESLRISRGAGSDINFEFGMIDDFTSFQINYRSNIFDHESIIKFSKHFINLLHKCLLDPNSLISKINILTNEEYKTIVYDWNNTYAPYPKDKTIHKLFEETVDRYPDNTAVVFEDKTLTYRVLNEKANQLAHFIRDAYFEHCNEQFTADTLIGIYIERSLEMIISILAILKAGGAYVPFDSADPEERLKYKIVDSNCKMVLTSSKSVEELLFLSETDTLPVSVDTLEDELNNYPANPAHINKPTDLAYVIYTSGSTGRPKGVMIEHRNVINLINEQKKLSLCNETKKTLQFASISFDASVWEIFVSLCSGGELYIVNDNTRRDSSALKYELINNEINIATIPPVIFEQIEFEDIESIETIVVAGDVTTSSTMTNYIKNNKRLLNAYGPTENTVCASVHQFNLGDSNINIGKPIGNAKLYILDSALNPLPLRVIGELYIGGDDLARGYLNNPELTKERFIDNPFASNEDRKAGRNLRLYKTGDLCRYLPDGNIEFIGRNDDQIKIRGFRIELGEIESKLNSYEGIKQSVVLCREKNNNKYLVAYYTISEDIDDGLEYKNDFVNTWQDLYDTEYSNSSNTVNQSNFSGWNSSYTGQPIPFNEMVEWRDAAIQRILSLQPISVYEIGCGSGLIMYPLINNVKSYTGIDFSEKVVKKLTDSFNVLNITNSRVFKAKADEIDRKDILNYTNNINTIIINSVIQYFPNVTYLDNVISKAVNIIKKGSIFIGDVRDYRLIQEFHTSVQLYKNSADSDIVNIVKNNIKNENELLISPEYFILLAKKYSEINYVEILPKRGNALHEMNKYRYDVIIHVGDKRNIDINYEIKTIYYHSNIKLIDLLNEETNSFLLESYPNKRIFNDCKETELLSQSNSIPLDIDNFDNENLNSIYDIEGLLSLGKENNWQLYISVSLTNKPSYDLVFYKAETFKIKEYIYNKNIKLLKTGTYSNNPLQNFKENKITTSKLKSYLSTFLPDYMIPSVFVEMKNFPLNTSGKIDRKSFPDLEVKENEENYLAPRNEIEERLCQIWKELLIINKVGIKDDFFKIGGNSILSIKLVSELNKSGYFISASTIKKYNTIEKLSFAITTNISHEKPRINIDKIISSSNSFELSPVQQWTFKWLDNDVNAYCVLPILKIKEKVNNSLLLQSINKAVLEVDTFYLSFGQKEKKWFQFYQRTCGIEVYDSDIKNKEDIYADLLNRHNRIDIKNGKLGSIVIYSNNTLSLLIHHLVIDGVSILNLVNNICSIYLDTSHPRTELSYKEYINFLKQESFNVETENKLELYYRSLLNKGDHKIINNNARCNMAYEQFIISINKERNENLVFNRCLVSFLMAISYVKNSNELLVHFVDNGRNILKKIELSSNIGLYGTQSPILFNMPSLFNKNINSKDFNFNFQYIITKYNSLRKYLGLHGIGRTFNEVYSNKFQNEDEIDILFNFIGNLSNGVDNKIFDYAGVFKHEDIAARKAQNRSYARILIVAEIQLASLKISLFYNDKYYTSSNIKTLTTLFKNIMDQYKV